MECFIYRIVLLLDYFLNPAHFASAQDHLDAVGMSGTFSEQLNHDPFGQGSCRLVLFLNNSHVCANLDLVP